MQLYGLAQQRHMLASMGIDVWIPRDLSNIQDVETSLYRDVVSADLPAIAPISVQPSAEVIQKQTESSTPIPATIRRDPIVAEPRVASAEAVSPEVVEVPTSPPAPVEAVLECPAFELQAVVLPHCILIIEGGQLTQAEQQLWLNIQAAQASQQFLLKWPFALAQFQDGRGVAAYVQGFLAAIQQEQSIIALGALPVQLDAAVVEFYSLQEMLEQPLLKRQLWQHMQGKVPH